MEWVLFVRVGMRKEAPIEAGTANAVECGSRSKLPSNPEFQAARAAEVELRPPVTVDSLVCEPGAWGGWPRSWLERSRNIEEAALDVVVEWLL